MAMIYDFLIFYTALTLPFIALGVYLAYRKKRRENKIIQKVQDEVLLRKTTKQNYNATSTSDLGFSIEIKQNDKIDAIISRIDRLESYLADHLALIHGDLTALLTSSSAVTKALLSEEKQAVKSPDYYVQQLQYARDRFAQTPAQRKALDSIISSIKNDGSTIKS